MYYNSMYLQTSRIDLSMVRCHVDVTIAALRQLQGGTGCHMKSLRDFVIKLNDVDERISLDNFDFKRTKYIEELH